MKERHAKDPAGDRPRRLATGTAGTLRKPLAPTPIIADASDQLWRKYCATRLRQFAAGR